MIFSLEKRPLLFIAFALLLILTVHSGLAKAQESISEAPIIDSDSGFIFSYSLLAPQPGPPTDLTADDLPNDKGRAVTIAWGKASGDNSVFHTVIGYLLFRSPSPDTGFVLLTRLPAGAGGYSDSDTSLVNGEDYYYKVASIYESDTLFAGVAGPAVPKAQFFHSKRIPVLLFMLIFTGTALYLISHSKRGGKLYIRPIAGIDAVDEAIGRATEMGRPILFVPGLGEASRVATIAAFTILARVARKVAEYQTRIIVPNYDPVVMTICQEVVKEAYASAGRPEAYDPKDVYFVTQDQFPYTASVNGTMLRERPATNFYMGMFYAESLILAETGFVAGSIQIAGTDQLIQIPFFVAACDYTLMGEELYAASAYLSKEPQQLGTLKAQDWGKVLAIALMFAGVIAYLFGNGAGEAITTWVRGG
ncbi:MAG: DUF6754 domain-containing protein [candidate division Zixibacteria bacterium]